MRSSKRMPVFYIPHGGGPCFFMDWTMGPPDTWKRLQDFLGAIPALLPEKPSAILIISAHWESANFSVTSGKNPSLIYDYYGFPEHTYSISYPASGNPDLSKKVCDMLLRSSIPCSEDANRGFDHGVFVPLKVMYPDADIPVVALSLKSSLIPGEHVEAGKAISSLRDEGVLILGSGMSYHNMQGFFKRESLSISGTFDGWLNVAVEKNQDERNEDLIRWEQAQGALESHPSEEHLIPLMVVSGAAGLDRGRAAFGDTVMGVKISAFQFG